MVRRPSLSSASLGAAAAVVSLGGAAAAAVSLGAAAATAADEKKASAKQPAADSRLKLHLLPPVLPNLLSI
jgi:hypothetical protein